MRLSEGQVDVRLRAEHERERGADRRPARAREVGEKVAISPRAVSLGDVRDARCCR
jgi:hypothetical protein